MLHRSFKSAKCKTSLKLAASRIKLLKNKREALVKQLKRELAQLLESGQDQTARIRVEHVVREEKTMAAYDLLEIYCELIVARLPIIESQKNCPIDLKEAISSVIFASPRSADVPELMDVRKHFTAKYGKEFVSAAVELRPDCGVSRLLVEKLSAKAPDGPTKIKILSAIAEEHQIKWDSKSFGEKESKPSEDLLNGPSTFGNASQMFVNPSYVHAPTGRDDKGPSSFQVPPKSNENQDVPINFQEENARSPPSYRTEIGTNRSNYSAAFHPESMPSGSGTETMEPRHSYAGDGNVHSMGRHDWNMEFKDATAAARAAAESAERASMAARAAAELSSRGNATWQYTAELQRDEEPREYTDSTLQSEEHAKGPVNSALRGRNFRMDYDQINGNQQDDRARISENFQGDSFKNNNKSSWSASLKSSATSVDDDPLVNNLPMAYRYSQKNSSELGQGDHLGQASFKKQSSRSEIDSVNKQQGALNPKNVSGFDEVRVRKQTSHSSSHSRSSSFRDDGDDDDVVSNFNSQRLGGDADENPFAVNNIGTIRTNSNKLSSPENAAAVFDDYGSDQDECKVDLEAKNKEHEYTDFSTHSRKSPTYMFGNTNAWNERQNNDESTHFPKEHSNPVFSQGLPGSPVPSHPDGMLPANFDDSDASISESEEELDKSELVRSKDTNRSNVYSRTSEIIHSESHRFIDSSFNEKGNEGSSKPWSQSSSFNTNTVEVNSNRHQGTGINAGFARKFGYGDLTTNQSSPRFTELKLDFDDPDNYKQQVGEEKHQQSQHRSRLSMDLEVRDNVLTPPRVEAMEDSETLKGSSLESGKELNFSTLTGGLRNKGHRRPPYIMSGSQNTSSSKQTVEDTSTKIEESLSATVNVSNSTGATSQDPYKKEVRTESDRRPSSRAHFGSRDDNSYGELPQQTSTNGQDRYSNKAGIEENKRSSSRTQVKYLDSTDSDSEDDFPKEALTNKPHLNPGFSRRTKASPSKSEKSSYTQNTVRSEASVSLGYGEKRSFPSTISYRTESRQKPQFENKSSGRLGSSEEPRWAEKPANKPVSEQKRSFFEESLKTTAKEQASNPLPKTITSGNAESLKTSSGKSLSKEKASHVHPKLPDYDAITAHLQSLRKNRQ